MPAADDLILNIPDGGFYRVLNVLQDEVEVQRIAISGGGGGSGPGGNFNQGNLSITLDSLQYDQTIVSKPYDIKYIIEATDSAGDPVYNEGIGTWTINNSTKVTETLYPGNNSFSINEYLDPSIEGYNIFSLTLSMNTGGEQNTIVNKKWYIKAVDLDLEWERTYSEANIITDEQFTLKWKPYGGVDCTTWVVFDDDPETMEAIEISAAQSGTDVLHTFKSLPYGVHNVKMYLSAEINGITEYSDTIQHELMFARNGSATLLAVPYYQKVAT